MQTKPKYKTKQREILTAYLATVPGKHVTVSEICDALRERDCAVGTTTVYRQLEQMVDEGLVQKYIIDANAPACFAYVADDAQCTQEHCFHCKCEQCGQLIHLHCKDLQEIGAHLKRHHGFVLNPLRTVFYGLCADCAKAEGKADAMPAKILQRRA